MNNGSTKMKEVKAGAGVGIGLVGVPLLLLIGKITGSLLKGLLWVGGIAFVAGAGAYLASKSNEQEN